MPPAVRLALAPCGGVARRLDGAWWPRSADLTAELPALLAALPPGWGPVTHVTVQGDAGRYALPDRLSVAGRAVGLRRIPHRRPGPGTLCLVSRGHGRRDLLIIPPDTPGPAAARLLAGGPAPAPLSRESPGRTPPPPPPRGPSPPTSRRYGSDGS